jgi:transposase
MRLDHNGYLPDFLVVTDGKQSDVTTAWQFPYEAGSITVFDRGYNDYSLFDHITKQNAFFVTRLKKNAVYETIKTIPLSADSDEDITLDSIIKLTGEGAEEAYEGNLRLIISKDTEGREVRFLTNNFELSTNTISEIYRERWKIELFFKEIKQNLKIKTFVGTTHNAVMTQIYTALISILILKYIKLKSSFNWSMSNLGAVLRMNLFTYKDLWKWIDAPFADTSPDNDTLIIQGELKMN